MPWHRGGSAGHVFMASPFIGKPAVDRLPHRQEAGIGAQIEGCGTSGRRTW